MTKRYMVEVDVTIYLSAGGYIVEAESEIEARLKAFERAKVAAMPHQKIGDGRGQRLEFQKTEYEVAELYEMPYPQPKSVAEEV